LINIDIVTLFPEIIDQFLIASPLKKTFDQGSIEVTIHQLRDFAKDKHNKVDDKQYGGDPGMVLMAQPLIDCVEHIEKIRNSEVFTVLLSPQGERINQSIIKKISLSKNVILVCGRYEGVDERFIEEKVDCELSIGDFIVSGGELPALIVLEALLRLIPGVLGDHKSMLNDSFGVNFSNKLKGPVYTRPKEVRNKKVPDVLLSGDHKEINKWRHNISRYRTKIRRKDL
tara:strand:+ start:534 stop:1217 length:684 start_codon:yes stop_codon:yes gene_type:complete